MTFLVVCNANSSQAEIPMGEDFGGKALSCLRVKPFPQHEYILGIDFNSGVALAINLERFGDKFRFIEKQLGEVVVDHSTLEFGAWTIDRKTLLANSASDYRWRCEIHTSRGELMETLNLFRERAQRDYDEKAAGNKI
jgi:hypothetical protein